MTVDEQQWSEQMLHSLSGVFTEQLGEKDLTLPHYMPLCISTPNPLYQSWRAGGFCERLHKNMKSVRHTIPLILQVTVSFYGGYFDADWLFWSVLCSTALQKLDIFFSLTRMMGPVICATCDFLYLPNTIISCMWTAKQCTFNISAAFTLIASMFYMTGTHFHRLSHWKKKKRKKETSQKYTALQMFFNITCKAIIIW